MLNIISTQIIIGPPCNAIRGLGELHANAGWSGERLAALAAGGSGSHSSPQVLLFGTQMELQVGPQLQDLNKQGGHQVDLGPASQQQDPQKSSRWHLGPSGNAGCTPMPRVHGCEQGAVHRSVDMCAPEAVIRLDAHSNICTSICWDVDSLHL